MKNREKIIVLKQEIAQKKDAIDEEYMVQLGKLFHAFTTQELLDLGWKKAWTNPAYAGEQMFEKGSRSVRFKEGVLFLTYGGCPTRSICDVDDLEYYEKTGK